MEWMLLLKAVLALSFVLGLLLLTLWAIKYLEVNGSKCRFVRKLSQDKRVEIVETKRLDARNTLFLVRRDNVEHLLVLGASNLVVEANIKPVATMVKGKKND